MNHAPGFQTSRRLLLALPCALIACAGAGGPPPPPPKPLAPGEVGLNLWRSLTGGFVSAAEPLLGTPARAGAGPYVTLLAPTAVALQGQELLVADSGTRRLWRSDLVLNAFVPVSGVAVTPTTAVALAPDLTAWVLDGPAGLVRRFARDGRVLQTLRLGAELVAPAGLALADLGATALVADAGQRQWLELRSMGALALSVRPRAASGGPVGVDAIAVAGERVWVLDRGAGRVHRVDRGGRVLASLGDGVLKQPVALAADRAGRVWVLDAQDHSVKLLREDRPVQVFDAADLNVRQPAAIAADDRALAVVDRLGGQVVVLRVQEGRS
jgi:sugar lactone lactonase YvrE